MNLIKKILCNTILIADTKPTFFEKLNYFLNIIFTCGPVAYLLQGFNSWFSTNQQFSTFVIICLASNMGVGAWYHHKMNTFSWEHFFKRNLLMWAVLIIVYAMLEMLRLTAGENIVADGFKVLIQITTLLYPISKVLKNIYILSNKQFPPEFIMEKIYNFEKNGDLKDLFNTDKKE
jgi:hypothetical protein